MIDRADAVVIGAGALGASTAYHLTRLPIGYARAATNLGAHVLTDTMVTGIGL